MNVRDVVECVARSGVSCRVPGTGVLVKRNRFGSIDWDAGGCGVANCTSIDDAAGSIRSYLGIQMLGPIELDANGEASGDGWRVARDRRGIQRLFYPSSRRCETPFSVWETGGMRLDEAIGAILDGDEMVASRMYFDTDGRDDGAYAPRKDLQAWARKVGWPGYEVEPQHLTCGPLRLEKSDHSFAWENDYGDDRWKRIEVYRVTDGCDAGLMGADGSWLLYVTTVSLQGACDCLASAIEASADPAVVRFREEHWRTGTRPGATLEITTTTGEVTRIQCEVEYSESKQPRFWEPVLAIEHWKAQMTKAQRRLFDEWRPEHLRGQGYAAMAPVALTAEIMVRWDYLPEEAERRARTLVARTIAPLSLLVATPEEQIALCRAREEGSRG